MVKKVHGIVAIVAGFLLAVGISSPALAWHPHGTITKTVQDIATNSAISSASDAASALLVSPGDTLTYTVTVSNTAAPAVNHDNDMAKTVMTDTLPGGVALTSNPAMRDITENIGTLVPGQSSTKQYTVTVTSTTEGDIISNKACFTGNSVANDNPQQGCSTVVIKVHVPETPTYACVSLAVTQHDNRSITITGFQQTADHGAVFKNVVVDWGDHTTPLNATSIVGTAHQYVSDGAYTVAAVAHFTVDGQDKTAASVGCTAMVSFSTPSQPVLPNTGAGSAYAVAAATAIAAYLVRTAAVLRRRNQH